MAKRIGRMETTMTCGRLSSDIGGLYHGTTVRTGAVARLPPRADGVLLHLMWYAGKRGRRALALAGNRRPPFVEHDHGSRFQPAETAVHDEVHVMLQPCADFFRVARRQLFARKDQRRT